MHLPSKNILSDLQDYMFTANNLNKFTKHMFQINIKPKSSLKHIINYDDNDDNYNDTNHNYHNTATHDNFEHIQFKTPISTSIPASIPTNKLTEEKKYYKETIYKPKQKDSLFWCFYILKHGYFNYEMEINNQYFTVEKTVKFKYIEILRKNKDILKIHKIKPFTELEDDLANKDKISVKTFFALCILENINVLLVDKRKIFELTCIDIDETHPVNVIHRNSKNYEHHIQFNITDTILKNYRETYYNSSLFEVSIKSISSYKLEELIQLCTKLDINISTIETGKKKMNKKDIYELLLLNY